MLLYTDGFDGSANLAYNWPLIPDNSFSVTSSVYRPGASSPRGSLMAVGAVGGKWLPMYFKNNYNTLIIGFAYRMDGNSQGILRFLSNATEVCVLGFDFANAPYGMYLLSGVTTTKLFPYTFNIGQWYYIEILNTVTLGGTTGTVTINIDGVRQYSSSAIINNSGRVNNMNTVALGNTIAAIGYYDDLYICDNSGTTNNNLLGNCRVSTILPNAAGTSSTWTPTAGANYTCVDESPDDGDTSYVYTSVANTDSYNYADSALLPEFVYGLQLNSIARKTAGTSRQVQNLITTAGNTEYGTATYLPESYGCLSMVLERVPPFANLNSWQSLGVTAITTINSSQFGFKLVS